MPWHNLTCFSWHSRSAPAQTARHSSTWRHTAWWQTPAIKYAPAQRRSAAVNSCLLHPDFSDCIYTVVWMLFSHTNLQSLIYLPLPKCPLIACSVSFSLSVSLSFSPPPLPENPLRICNNGVVDWIKQYNVWWRGRSGEKSMGRCDLLSC